MATHRALPLTLLAAVAALPFATAQTLAPVASGDAPAAGQSRAVGAEHGPRAHGDPRVCLEYATNPEVIACAEKYRPQRRKA